MEEHHVQDYSIIRSAKNKGVVRNVLNAYSIAEGRYVKLLSPNDYFYDDTALAGMLHFMESEGHRIAFGRSCYYSMGTGSSIFTTVCSHINCDLIWNGIYLQSRRHILYVRTMQRDLHSWENANP